MIERNPNFMKLTHSYLFQEIALKVKEYQAQNPQQKLYNLGIGDTTIPLSTSVTEPLSRYIPLLSTREGYRGYQHEQGSKILRELIIDQFYGSSIITDELFLSDGAKCDIGRLQQCFSHLSPVMIQDPTYPVYRDGTLLHGDQKILYAQCLPEHDFFPVFSGTPKLIYICSPNNPTGTALTYIQLEKLVAYAHDNNALIIYDAAYRYFIEGNEHPRSIYEIPGASTVAIEVNSFSKFAGFTGIRLGWTIIPKALGSIYSDYMRLHTTLFNGASLLAQKAGEFVLQEGFSSCMDHVRAYKENTSMLRQVMKKEGYMVYGGVHAPYVWIHTPGTTSWETFQQLLTSAHIIVTPGSGFGSAGEEFVRLSGLFHPDDRDEIYASLTSRGTEFAINLTN